METGKGSTILERLKNERSQLMRVKEEISKELEAVSEDGIEAVLEALGDVLSAKKDEVFPRDTVSIKFRVNRLGASESHIIIDKQIIDVQKYKESVSDTGLKAILETCITESAFCVVLLRALSSHVKYGSLKKALEEQGLSVNEKFKSIPGQKEAALYLAVTANLVPNQEGQSLTLEQ